MAAALGVAMATLMASRQGEEWVCAVRWTQQDAKTQQLLPMKPTTPTTKQPQPIVVPAPTYFTFAATSQQSTLGAMQTATASQSHALQAPPRPMRPWPCPHEKQISQFASKSAQQ